MRCAALLPEVAHMFNITPAQARALVVSGPLDGVRVYAGRRAHIEVPYENLIYFLREHPEWKAKLTTTSWIEEGDRAVVGVA